MTGFAAAWTAEVHKAARSRIPAVTVAVFTLVPVVGALFIFILANPEQARRLGLLNQKAELSGVSADWSGMLAFSAQAVAVGSLLLFAFIATWVFGQEFADGTARYLMALPTSRATIVAAKLTLFTVWAALLSIWLVAATLLLGGVVGLPGWTSATGVAGARHILGSAALMIPAIMPIGYVASRARGYLPPLAAAIGLLVVAQLGTVLGWGAYLPWSIPAAAAGLVPDQHVGPVSIGVTVACGVLGAVATIQWWRSADAGR